MATMADDQKLQRAYALHQSGAINEAAAIYRELISRNAANAAALHLLGIIEAGRGDLATARALMGRSLAIQPANVQWAENYAAVLLQSGDAASALKVCEQALRGRVSNVSVLYISAVSLLKVGRLQESVARFDRVLAQQPSHLPALNERGSALALLKQYDAALASVDRALSFDSNSAQAHLNRGNILSALKRYDEALTAYDRAVSLFPNLADGWLGRGNIFRARKQFDDALAAYDVALRINPDFANAYLGRGNTFFNLNRHNEAAADYRKALDLAPQLPEAWLGCGSTLAVQRHYDEAFQAIDKALSLNPDLADAWLVRGHILHTRVKYRESLADFDRAVALRPDYAEAWVGRGVALLAMDRANDALAALDRAVTLDPDLASARSSRATALMAANRTAEAIADYRKALSIKPDDSVTISSLIFALDFAKDAGFVEQQEARKYWWQRVGAPLAKRPRKDYQISVDPDRKIRVGYVSSDFREHSAARCFWPMIQGHNKDEFEITCYSASTTRDGMTENFRRATDRWRDVSQTSDDELYEMILSDQIDLLVDLSGHTAGHRLEVFARKPAPVQVSAGATGTGLMTMDYLFSDRITCPLQVRSLFAEQIFDLPSIMTIEPPPHQPEDANTPAVSKGYVTFGVFNRASKNSEEAVAVWASILNDVPHSRILMKHTAFDDEFVRRRQLERFSTLGISDDRVSFLGGTSREDHLAAFRDVDISLDPFPQNGGISTLESLQMGVPVIALLGDSISSRAAGSILATAGLNAWIAENLDEYRAIAVRFASDSKTLATLRRELPQKVAASAVGNPAIYTKAIEAAYRTMWIGYCRKHPACAAEN